MMVRGLGRRPTLADAADRGAFLGRLAALARGRGRPHGVRLGPAPKSLPPPGGDRNLPIAPEYAPAPHRLFAYVRVEHLGRRASDLARALGQTRGNMPLAAKRGAAHAAA